MNQGTTWNSSTDGNDNFKVKELTQSLYVSDDYHFAFVRLKAGLRYEFTQLNTKAENDLNTEPGNYGVLLPNVSLTANIDLYTMQCKRLLINLLIQC